VEDVEADRVAGTLADVDGDWIIGEVTDVAIDSIKRR